MAVNKPWFPKQEEKFKEIKILTGDIETEGLGGKFLLGMIYDGKQYFTFSSPEEMFEFFITKKYAGYRLLFHNLEYDFRYFLEPIKRFLDNGYTGESRCRGDKKIIGFSLRAPAGNRCWHIQDTYALFAAPLRALSVFAGEEKHDIGLAEDVVFDPTNPEHVEYLKADVRILYQAYRAYHRVLHQTFGINPRLTAGGCAIAAMSRYLPYPIYRQREPVQAFVRKAYFGGLTFLRSRVSHREADQWDARGMYAWAMKQPLPIGRAFYTREEHPDLLGIYKVGVRAPEDIPFTFVPYRLREGGVAWPTGKFVTYLPSVTISYARTLGYQIDVLEGYVFPGYDYPLKTFIERCEELELENKGNALGAAIKILRNSGYGKFAQKKQHNKLIFNPAPPDGAMPIFDLQTGLNIASAYVITEEKEPEYGFIEWAAFITAYARFNLARAVYQAGPENVVLGDTDSLVTIRQRRPEPYIGPKYGDYKHERRYQLLIPVAPKVYAGYTEDGQEVIKCKGIPVKYCSVSDFEHPFVKTFTSVRSIAAILRGSPFAQEVSRSVSDLNHSRSWRIVGDRVVPITIHESW